MIWDDLNYWRCGEWQVIQEELDDLDKKKTIYNPRREDMFAAMDAVEMSDVSVAIMGQDPYPTRAHSTGIAFSVPRSCKVLPPTLDILLKEYVSDLGYEKPKNGNLNKWCKRGVFLWNVIPTCLMGRPLSHNWTEYEYLTKEIVEELTKQPMVFIFMGAKARNYAKYVDNSVARTIECSHPSPRGSISGKNPFLGSRVFTTANAKLCELKKDPINWRL